MANIQHEVNVVLLDFGFGYFLHNFHCLIVYYVHFNLSALGLYIVIVIKCDTKCCSLQGAKVFFDTHGIYDC